MVAPEARSSTSLTPIIGRENTRLRSSFATVVLMACAALVGACVGQAREERRAAGEHLVQRARASMGTELQLTAWTADEAGAVAAFDAVFGEFDHLENLMSVWREGSDILRLNAAAGEHPVPVSPEVREALGIAHQVSDWTGGKFDVTFGALSGLWKFDYQDKDGTPKLLERCTLPLTGVDCYQKVVTDYGVLEVVKGTHFRLLEWAPDIDAQAVVRATGAKVEIAKNARPMEI